MAPHHTLPGIPDPVLGGHRRFGECAEVVMETEKAAAGDEPYTDSGGGVQLRDPRPGHILRGALVDS